MSELRRMLSSVNALFVFEAAARTGSFTKAAAELNVTQPAVSRMLSSFERHLGLSLFERTGKGVTLTEEGEYLYKQVSEGFRIIEAGLQRIESQRRRAETVTLSISSAFMTHWLMPRIDRFQKRFPKVDIRFQLIGGPIRGPLDNVDLGMRFIEDGDDIAPDAFVCHEVMLPVCSPSYLNSGKSKSKQSPGHTIIHLAGSETKWATELSFIGGRRGISETLFFSDYSVVIQAALLSQGIALGWLNVVAHAMTTNALVPATRSLLRSNRRCVLLSAPGKSPRPIVKAIRSWIIDELRADIEALDAAYPYLGLKQACY